MLYPFLFSFCTYACVYSMASSRRTPITFFANLIAAHLLRALHKFQHTCVERLLTNISRHFQGVFSLPTKTRSVSSNRTTANLCAN